MSESFKSKNTFEETREVTFDRWNGGLWSLFKTVQEKKLEVSFERFKLWKEKLIVQVS
jgi:hypothetical protein